MAPTRVSMKRTLMPLSGHAERVHTLRMSDETGASREMRYLVGSRRAAGRAKVATWVLLVIASAGAATSCGAGSSSSDGRTVDERAISAISEGIQTEQGRLELPPLDAERADCVARGLVERPGTQALIQHGILTSDLTVDTTNERLAIPKEPATQMVDAMTACVDLAEMERMEESDSQDGEGWGEDPPWAKKCFNQTLDDDGVRVILLAGLTGDNSGMRALNRALSLCMISGGRSA